MSEPVLAVCCICGKEVLWVNELDYFVRTSRSTTVDLCKNCYQEDPTHLDAASPVIIAEPSLPDEIRLHDEGKEEPIKRAIIKQREKPLKYKPRGRPKWTPQQIEKLKKLYATTPPEELAKIIGRSISSIASKAGWLRLERNPNLIKRMKPKDITAARRFERFCQKEWGMSGDEVDAACVVAIFEPELREAAAAKERVKLTGSKGKWVSLKNSGVIQGSGQIDIEMVDYFMSQPCNAGVYAPWDTPVNLDEASYPELISALEACS